MPRAFCIYLLASTAMAQIQPAPPAAASSGAGGTGGTGSIEGIVSDATSHAPLRKVQVTLTGAIAVALNAVTDAGGRFAFRELAAGSYWLGAWKPGYNPPQAIFAAEAQSAGVVLGDGEQRKDIEIAIELPIEFIELCEGDGVTPEIVLRGFIADLAGIHNWAANPRADG